MSEIVARRVRFQTRRQLYDYLSQNMQSEEYSKDTFNRMTLAVYGFVDVFVNRFHHLIIKEFARSSERLSECYQRVFGKLILNYEIELNRNGAELTDPDKSHIRDICGIVCFLEFPNFFDTREISWPHLYGLASAETFKHRLIPESIFAESTIEGKEEAKRIMTLKDTRRQHFFSCEKDDDYSFEGFMNAQPFYTPKN